jgi:hypothetical protein
VNVDYIHEQNIHSLEGARAVLPVLFGDRTPTSLLDVGCGEGTWTRAALEFGIGDVLGLDGVDVDRNRLLVRNDQFRLQDLTRSWSLGRQFEATLCLEVAEHLSAATAPTLIACLVAHSDWIAFSAASPGQPGQHHVNCQWPEYWQALFNQQGYVCSDEVRWQIWNDPRVEPWYRQNLFIARRDPAHAGKESRLAAVIHPEMFRFLCAETAAQTAADQRRQIESGQMRADWYISTPLRALMHKMSRRFRPFVNLRK